MMKKKRTVAIGLVAICGLLALLNACSENKGQDTPSAAKNVSQPNTAKGAGGQAATPTTPPGDGGKCAALLTDKCTACHSTVRVCEKLGKKSKARWQRSVERMIERGAKLNADEAAALLVCLDSGTNDLKASCQ